MHPDLNQILASNLKFFMAREGSPTFGECSENIFKIRKVLLDDSAKFCVSSFHRHRTEGSEMWNDSDNGCDDASDGYVDLVSDGIYIFTLLAGIAVLAVIVWALT